MVTRSRAERQVDGQGTEDRHSVQSESASFGDEDTFVLAPSEFCLPEEYFVVAEEYPSASNGEIFPDPRFQVVSDEPEGGIGTNLATETTEPIVGAGTESGEIGTTAPDLGADPMYMRALWSQVTDWKLVAALLLNKPILPKTAPGITNGPRKKRNDGRPKTSSQG